MSLTTTWLARSLAIATLALGALAQGADPKRAESSAPATAPASSRDAHGDAHDDTHGHPHATPDAAAAAIAKRASPWSPRTIELASTLAVQDGGRVKPLSTFASFTLLRLNGKRSVTTPEGDKLAPTAWLLDLLFFPESSSRYPCFVVQNSEVIDAIGLTIAGKKKRDHYSFDELQPGMQRLFTLAHQYGAIEEKSRDAVQQQIVNLAENVNAFLSINGHEILAIVPPIGSVEQEEEWFTLLDLVRRGQEAPLPDAHMDALDRFEKLGTVRTEPAAFERELEGLHARLVGLASARGEYDKVGLEVRYYSLDLLTWSQVAFLLGFLAMAFMWLFPKSRLLYGGAWAAAATGTLLLATAIVFRCIIRSRPPVSTLYETVLFVTAVGAIVALITEGINKKRLALSAAIVLGVVGVFIANGYESLDKKDTMPSLVAVLDTNFWLATHVTSITIGYAAGMLAALLASLYLLAKVLRIKRTDRAFYSSLGRMVYGVICFGVIFATVGTILGGIWANDSWGRFWGWDPKENGALLIVLTQIGILHGRMGGYLREHGVCMAAALGGTVVAFSWWGVNLLGVGLHSYGFTSGIHTALWTYYAIQWSIVGLGAVAWFLERAEAKRTTGAPVAPVAREAQRERGVVGSPEPAASVTSRTHPA